LIVGGLPVPPQIYRLESGVQLIVATPGRLLDILINYDICLPEGKMLFDQIRCCVVDEVDVMLGIGFQKQIVQLLSHLPQLITKDDNDRKRNIQMLFFSATITKEVNALAHKFMSKNIEETSYHITVGGANGLCNSLSTTTKEKEGYKASLNLNIIQHIEWVETKAKKKILFAYLKDHQLFGHQDTTGQTVSVFVFFLLFLLLLFLLI
jgi:ATP-dependent RNA helicase DDX59